MKTPFRSLRLALACAIALTAPAGAATYINSDLLPLQTGFTVATCYSSSNLGGGITLPPPDPEGNVVVVWKTSPGVLSGAPMNAPASANYAWQFYHNEIGQQNPVAGSQHEWKAKHLGEVFGVSLDDAQPPNIYVAASTCYGAANWPLSNGAGRIYRLDATDGSITPFFALPGASGGATGPGIGWTTDAGLGNLCWVRTNSGTPWIYVTNMGDGLIYRVHPVTMLPTATFDHGTQGRPAASFSSIADNPGQVFTQATRRPWGIGYHCGRLYYSIFDSTDPAPPSGPQSEIWSVALDNLGNFQPATTVREFKVPPLALAYPGFGSLNRSSMPVSDIEFTLAGAMILAERYHTNCTTTAAPPFPGLSYLLGAHSTRVLEYTGATGAWVPSPQNKFRVGAPPWGNSAGGVGPTCDGSVWCTGDALGPYQAVPAYGQQRIRGSGNNQIADITPYTLSHIIDFDCTGQFYGKSLIGDVDTVIEPVRLIAKVVNAACPGTPGGPYTVTINVRNMMTVPMNQVGFGPCPPEFFPPPGSPTVQSLVPSPALYNFSPALAPYASQNITVTLNALPIGGLKCFSIQGNPGDFSGGGGVGHETAFNCSPKLCVNLPKCPCMSVATSNIQCPPFIGQDHTATIAITNLWSIPADFWELLPCPVGDLPAGAVTVQPNPVGLQSFSPVLGPGNTSAPLNISFPGLPYTPTQVCFIVRLLPQNWEMEGPICEFKVCINYPQCNPPPCATATLTNIRCPVGPPGNYTATLNITNLTPNPVFTAFLTPCPPPSGPGFPATVTPPTLNLGTLLQNQTGSFPIQIGGVGTSGVTACFCISIWDAVREICRITICQPLPPCPCATFVLSNVTCPQYEGQPYTATVTVTNTGFQPFSWISFTACQPQLLPLGAIPGVGVGPSGLLPFPLNPGNSAPYPITLTGIPKAGGIICFNVGVFGQDEAHPLCREKLCINVPPCPPCLPCMGASAVSVLCPTVQGGPFTAAVTITNLQPVTAASALLIPCPPGQLPPGGVNATPVPGSVTFTPALAQNASQTVNVGLSGVTSGQFACFCIRLRDVNGNTLCERMVCLTMPLCPPLCANISTLAIDCPQGGGGYSAFLGINNQSGSTFAFYQTCPVPAGQLPAGALTGQPAPAGMTPLAPNIPNGGFGGAPVTLPPSLPATGATFCFIIKFFGEMDNLICQQKVCLTLPPCQCGAILSHSVDCVPTPGGGVKRQITVSVQNYTNVFGPAFNFDVATIAPGLGFSPAVVTPSPNPIPPGGTGTLTFCYTGNKPPQCVHILLTNNARTRCCPLKLCPLWVECAQPETPDRCHLSSRLVADNANPVSTTAWIFNGSNTPKVYNFTIVPVSVPGCTGTLPPVALQPASGTTLTVGAFSSLGIPFTINPSSLAAGQCAAFRVCFQEAGPVFVPPICCISKITRSNNTDVCVDWDPIGVGIPVGAGLKTIVIKNPTSAVMPVSLRLVQTGGVEFSLTGEFPSADGSAAGGPPADLDYLPIETVLEPHQVMPITFTARVKAIPFPGPGPGPVWAEWQLLKLCNVLPVDPVDPIDDPHTLVSSVQFIPNATPTGPLPEDLRDFRFIPGGDPDFDTLSLLTSPGEILRPHYSDNLHDFFPDWVLPYATVQGPDGSVAGTGYTLYATSPRPVSPGLQKLRRFLRWLH